MSAADELREFAFRVLTQADIEALQATLRAFKAVQSPERLVQEMSQILQTPDQQRFYHTIGRFIPQQFAGEYQRAVHQLFAASGGDEESVPMSAGRGVAATPSGGSSKVVTEDGFLVNIDNRGDAETMLIEGGATDGVFLVRRKNGGDNRDGAWVLSFVLKGKISHQKIEQSGGPGSVLSVGGLPLGNCTSLQGLVAHLRTAPGYMLTGAPYQAQQWFHGTISRDEAEARLLKLPLDGRFLVRKSSRDKLTSVISVVSQGAVSHFQVRYGGNGWSLQVDSVRSYATLVDVLKSCTPPLGSSKLLLLKAPCPRPEPCM